MRGDTVFGGAVHLPCADLYLERHTPVAEQGRMQRTVHIRLGHGDIILESAGHGLPKLMNDAQNGIAVTHRTDYHAQCNEVIDLVDAAFFVVQLAVDAVNMLAPSADLAVDAVRLQLGFYLLLRIIKQKKPLLLLGSDERLKPFEFIGHEIAEGGILKLAFDCAHTESIRKRSVDLKRFLGLPDALFPVAVFEGTHIVKPVGELDDNDSDIARDGKEHPAKVLRLTVLLVYHVGKIGFGELCDA